MSTATLPVKKQIQWGYAGVYPGAFKVWEGDELMNKLRFAHDQGFASSSLGWGAFRDPSRREQILAYTSETGLALTIHSPIQYWLPDRQQVFAQIDTFLAELAEVKQHLAVPMICTGAGCGHRFDRARTVAERWDHLAEILKPLARGLHDLGSPLGVENHGDFYVSDIVQLCERVPHLGIYFDTGNTFLIGEKPLPAAREAAPFTIGTHFKDHYVQPNARELKFEIEGAPLGEGHVGLGEIYEILVRNAPQPEKLAMQWEMVPPKDMDAWECLKRSWKFVRSLPPLAELRP